MSAIYVQTLSTAERTRVSSRAGINGAPAWSPDGGKLALTRTPISVDTTPLRIQGFVGSSLYRSARAAGTSPADRSRMELGDPRLVHTDFLPDLLHRRLLVVIEADDLLLTWRQRRNGGAHTIGRFGPLVRHIRLLGFGRDQRLGQRRFVEFFVVGQGRGRLDGVDANNRAAKTLLVGAKLVRQIGQRRLVAEFAGRVTR